jgi:hypothetical protein
MRTDHWLLRAAVAIAAIAQIPLAAFYLNASTGLPLANARAPYAAAFFLLAAWFAVLTQRHPGRPRTLMLTGLLLAALQIALGGIGGLRALPSGTEPVPEAFGMAFQASWTALLGMAALVCYLLSFLALPGRGQLGSPRWRPALAVALLLWLADLAVRLQWLAPVLPIGQTRPVLTLAGVLLAARDAITLGLAIALLLVVIELAAGMAVPGRRAAVVGAALLVAVRSAALTLTASWLPIWAGAAFSLVLSTLVQAAGFVGSLLLALAAARAVTAKPRRRARQRSR